ncbi:MAG: hypothetical protein PW734_08995 [Verrucomicrobium sp.]|nr:hypothetical protein [Verrucomicrobium sp.]
MTAASAFAETEADPFDALFKAVEATARTDGAVFPSPLNHLRQALRESNYAQARTAINNITRLDPSPAMLEATAALSAEISKTVTARRDVWVREAQTALKSASDAVAASRDAKEKNPASFDLILSTLGAVQNRDSSISDVAPLRNELNAAIQYVQRWQGYLVALQTGNNAEARDILHSLAGGSPNFMPIPRSWLLEQTSSPSQPSQPTRGAVSPVLPLSLPEPKTLDDLPSAIAQLRAANRSSFSPATEEKLQTLTQLLRAYQCYQQGDYEQALLQLRGNTLFSDRSGDPGTTPALQRELRLKLAAALLDRSDAPAPKAEEDAMGYLLRLAADDQKKKEWSLLRKDLQAYSELYPPTGSSWVQEDLRALHSFLVGEKQEQAGETLDAIRSYRQALTALGRYFPAAPVAEKLTALEKKFPDLYRQAVSQPIAALP